MTELAIAAMRRYRTIQEVLLRNMPVDRLPEADQEIIREAERVFAEREAELTRENDALTRQLNELDALLAEGREASVAAGQKLAASMETFKTGIAAIFEEEGRIEAVIQQWHLGMPHPGITPNQALCDHLEASASAGEMYGLYELMVIDGAWAEYHTLPGYAALAALPALPASQHTEEDTAYKQHALALLREIGNFDTTSRFIEMYFTLDSALLDALCAATVVTKCK